WAVLAAGHAGVGAGVPDVADHLTTIHRAPDAHAAGHPRQVPVAEHGAVGGLEPHLAPAEPVELLLAGAVGDVVEQPLPRLGAELDVAGVGPDHLGGGRGDHG